MSIIKEEPIDSAALYREKHGHYAFEVLMRAQACWEAMSEFRRERQRNKDYVNGKQWGDMIKVGGKWMSEEQYLTSQGNVPLKNNLIKSILRRVTGAYKQQNTEPTAKARNRANQSDGEVFTELLRANGQRNMLTDLNTRAFEEFLISGVCVYRKFYGRRNTRRGNLCECWTDMVSPRHFFVDGNMEDFRTWDADIVGQIHDVSFEQLCSNFCIGERGREMHEKLREEYKRARDRELMMGVAENFGMRKSAMSFLMASDPSVCRVIEVWTKEQKERYHCHDTLKGECYKVELEELEAIEAENEARLQQVRDAGMDESQARLIKTEYFIDDYWYYRFITPTGLVLDEGETPYAHGTHPFVFRCYPFIDGEIHSFVADLIDQQRYVNRLITMQDFIMRSSAKGVLLVPTDAIPEGMTLADFAEEWSSYNGVIAFKAKPGVPLPTQIHGQVSNMGVSELLNLQIKLFDVIGADNTLQGASSANMSGVLFQQKTQNANTSISDYLGVFSGFINEGAVMDVKNMQQFYDEQIPIRVTGRPNTVITFDPDKHSDVELDIAVTQDTSSAVYREIGNDFLLQLLQMQQISVEELLEFGSFPQGDALLQSIQARKQELQQQQMAMQQQGMAPAV